MMDKTTNHQVPDRFSLMVASALDSYDDLTVEIYYDQEYIALVSPVGFDGNYMLDIAVTKKWSRCKTLLESGTFVRLDALGFVSCVARSMQRLEKSYDTNGQSAHDCSDWPFAVFKQSVVTLTGYTGQVVAIQCGDQLIAHVSVCPDIGFPLLDLHIPSNTEGLIVMNDYLSVIRVSAPGFVAEVLNACITLRGSGA